MPFLRARGSRPSRKAAGVQSPLARSVKTRGLAALRPCRPDGYQAHSCPLRSFPPIAAAHSRSSPQAPSARLRRCDGRRMIAGQKPVEVTRAWITEAGRTTLRVEKC
jgi:hypothetical protein